ncbi:MAG: holo-ACP synthase [Anaerolineae bacterium]|nr:holo-ACP synthase [Anaerolineae bacterium]
MAREVHDALNESLAHALDLIGLGIDVVDVAWSERLLEQHPTRLTRMYTEAELEYCRQKVQPAPYLAARMAAKEAVLKALGTGLVGGMAWHEVEITREEPGGKPGVQLHGECAPRGGGRRRDALGDLDDAPGRIRGGDCRGPGEAPRPRMMAGRLRRAVVLSLLALAAACAPAPTPTPTLWPTWTPPLTPATHRHARRDAHPHA